MEDYEKLKAVVEERKKIREKLKDIKPADFEKKEEEKKEAVAVKKD
jgi:hypothetical protein